MAVPAFNFEEILKIIQMEFAHYRPEHIILLDNLKNEVIHKTLAYMVDFKEHENLVVIPKTYSIEISNAEICIAVIIFSGFEKEEYETIKTTNNLHFISFNHITQTMFEFENIHIKHIDPMALFFTSLSRTGDANIKEFLQLRNPCSNETLYRSKKEYSLKDIIWNLDLFSLIYKRHKTKSNKIKNKFTTAIVLKSYPVALKEENIRNISSSLILEFVKNKKLITEKVTQSELEQSKPLLVCFAVESGRCRAQKAIKMALSTTLLNETLIENTKTILLLISSDIINVNIDEIGLINDFIQKKLGLNPNIITIVSEEKNLKKSLSVTLMLSEFEISETAT